MVREDKSKIGFQDGSCGGHLRFLISKILYSFDLQVILLLQCNFHFKSPSGSGADIKLLLHHKFLLNSLCGLREDVQNRFSIWRLWRPSLISDQHNVSSFQSRSRPVVTEQVLAQTDQRFVKSYRKLVFKMAAVAATLDFRLTKF